MLSRVRVPKEETEEPALTTDEREIRLALEEEGQRTYRYVGPLFLCHRMSSELDRVEYFI